MGISTTALTVFFLLSTSLTSAAWAGGHSGLVDLQNRNAELGDVEKRLIEEDKGENISPTGGSRPPEARLTETIAEELKPVRKELEENEGKAESLKNQIQGLITGGIYGDDPAKGPAKDLNSVEYLNQKFTPGITDAAKDIKTDSFQFRKKVNELISGLTDKSLKNLNTNIKDVVKKLGLKGEQKKIFEQSVKAWGDSPAQNKNDLGSQDPGTKFAAKKAIEGKFEELARANQGAIPKDFKLPGDDSDAFKSKAYLLERQPLLEQMNKAKDAKEYIKAGEIQKQMETLSENALKGIVGATNKESLAEFSNSIAGKKDAEKAIYSEINNAANAINKSSIAAESTTPNTTGTAAANNPDETATSKLPPQKLKDIVELADPKRQESTKAAFESAGSKISDAVSTVSPGASRLLKSVMGNQTGPTIGAAAGAAASDLLQKGLEGGLNEVNKKQFAAINALNTSAATSNLTKAKVLAGSDVVYQSSTAKGAERDRVNEVTTFDASGKPSNLSFKGYNVNDKKESFARYESKEGKTQYMAVEKAVEENGAQKMTIKRGASFSDSMIDNSPAADAPPIVEARNTLQSNPVNNPSTRMAYIGTLEGKKAATVETIAAQTGKNEVYVKMGKAGCPGCTMTDSAWKEFKDANQNNPNVAAMEVKDDQNFSLINTANGPLKNAFGIKVTGYPALFKGTINPLSKSYQWSLISNPSQINSALNASRPPSGQSTIQPANAAPATGNQASVTPQTTRLVRAARTNIPGFTTITPTGPPNTCTNAGCYNSSGQFIRH